MRGGRCPRHTTWCPRSSPWPSRGPGRRVVQAAGVSPCAGQPKPPRGLGQTSLACPWQQGPAGVPGSVESPKQSGHLLEDGLVVGIQRDALVHDLPLDGHPGVTGVQVLQGQTEILTPPEPSPPLPRHPKTSAAEGCGDSTALVSGPATGPAYGWLTVLFQQRGVRTATLHTTQRTPAQP